MRVYDIVAMLMRYDWFLCSFEFLIDLNQLLQIVADAPWTLTDEFITANKIDFVAHDDIPYTGEGVDDIYGWLKAKGMFVATERTEGMWNRIYIYL